MRQFGKVDIPQEAFHRGVEGGYVSSISTHSTRHFFKYPRLMTFAYSRMTPRSDEISGHMNEK
jgi:hypothetical protein